MSSDVKIHLSEVGMKVLCFNDFSNEPIDPPQVCDSSAVRPGFKMTGGARKFIVMEDKSTPQNLALAIGPLLQDDSYLHSKILRFAEDRLPGFGIAGGGEVEFSGCSNFWVATFSGYSGDFGVFTPRILTVENRSAVAEALKMTVVFQWEGDASPRQ